MGFLKPNPPRTKVEVVQSTHGQTYVTWPTNITASGDSLPPLPVDHSHARSRHWVLADKTAVLILPGDPQVHQGGVVRHVFDVEVASWNRRTKTLASLVKHPTEPNITFGITTSGVGCACTQGAAGNAGPIGEPYEISMVNPNDPEFSEWFTLVAS
jgi:hypothetical protein